MKKNSIHQCWAKIIAKAWADEKFKQKLLENPDQVLRENGIELPKDKHAKIHENSSKVLHFMLPEKPQDILSEEELRDVRAGGKGGEGAAGVNTCFTTSSSGFLDLEPNIIA